MWKEPIPRKGQATGVETIPLHRVDKSIKIIWIIPFHLSSFILSQEKFQELRQTWVWFIFAFVFSHLFNYTDDDFIQPFTRRKAKDQGTSSSLYQLLVKKHSAALYPGNVTHFCQFSFSQWVKFNQYFVSEGLVAPQRKITGVKI